MLIDDQQFVLDVTLNYSENKMKIRLLSDLHLEFSSFTIANDTNADVLVLAGDIMIAGELHALFKNPLISQHDMSHKHKNAIIYHDFLAKCSTEFKHVLYVLGNHEYYHGLWHKSIEHIKTACEKYPNIHIMENSTVKIDDINFVGATLWTDLNKSDPLTVHAVVDMMNDFKCIHNDKNNFKKIRPLETVIRHRYSLDYFRQCVLNARERNESVVIISHHCPTHLSIVDQYRNDTIVNGAFVSDLSEFILDHPEIKYWFCGHTHHAHRYMLGSTEVVCNPRGYQTYSRNEHTRYDPELTLDI